MLQRKALSWPHDADGRSPHGSLLAYQCSHRDMMPYRGSQCGSYAAGASYYLGPIAIDTLVRDHFKYREEFNTELFEDKGIGSILIQNGIESRPAEIAGLLRLRMEEWVRTLK